MVFRLRFNDRTLSSFGSGDLGPSPIKNWSEREEAVGDKIVEARGALAHCMVSEPDSFRSPVTNEHTQHIGGLNIVAAPLDTPLLLLTNLPLGKQGRVATDDEVLKWFHEADNEPITPPPTAVLLGPPGIGKTRKCMHLGSIEPGVIYLTCERSGELRAPDMEAVRAKLEQCEAEPQSWKANFARAKRHLLACLYARVSLLKYFLENQARQAWDLRHWMLFQSGVAFGASMVSTTTQLMNASRKIGCGGHQFSRQLIGLSNWSVPSVDASTSKVWLYLRLLLFRPERQGKLLPSLSSRVWTLLFKCLC